MNMDQFERQKQVRQALNGKMSLMFGGIFLIFSAITSTLRYGIAFFMMALEADKGTAEYVEVLEKAGVASTLVKVVGICFVIVGIWEVVVGFFSAKNSNRIDKSSFTLKMIISLLAVEVIMQVFLFFTGFTSLGLLVTAILLPLFMLWGVTRFRKIAKAEPERVYAVDNMKNKPKRPAANQQPVPKKSIRERAAMQARLDEESTAADTEKEDAVQSGEKAEAHSETEESQN